MIKIGQKYHKITVLSQDGRYSNGGIKWLVRCDCGREYYIRSRPRGKMCRSCASSLPRYGGRQGYGDITGTRWGAIKRHARQRKIKFGIEIEEAWSLFLRQDGRCAMTNVKFSLTMLLRR